MRERETDRQTDRKTDRYKNGEGTETGAGTDRDKLKVSRNYK
jgi:hypothetical protein